MSSSNCHYHSPRHSHAFKESCYHSFCELWHDEDDTNEAHRDLVQDFHLSEGVSSARSGFHLHHHRGLLVLVSALIRKGPLNALHHILRRDLPGRINHFFHLPPTGTARVVTYHLGHLLATNPTLRVTLGLAEARAS